MAEHVDVTEGELPGGLPYFRLGSGPRLIVLRGFTNVYGHELLRGTADGVRDGRLIVYPGASHASTMTHKRLASDVADFLT